jgi:peptidoglycan/LPS O-acetylase OafA/YrhL
MPATAPPLRPTTLPYYPALTGLRAVAAYLVFFVHFIPAGLSDWAARVIGQFYVGVGMFFVLSGFVIATRYQSSVQWTRAWWRYYVWRRAARIYPIFLLLNGITLAYVYLPVPPDKGANSLLLVLLSQSLLHGFSRTLKFVGIPQAWSLTVEECFYFSAPILLLAWRRWGSKAAAVFVLSVLSLGLGLTALLKDRADLHGLFGSYRHMFNFSYFGRVLEFVMGVGLARWWAAYPGGNVVRWPWRTLAGIGIMGLAVGLLAWVHSPIDWYDGLRYPTATALKDLLFPAGVTLLLAGLLAERSWLRAILATPLLQALGRSSYFFYLIHYGLLSIWWQARFGYNQHVILQFLLTILLAQAGYRLLEVPLYRWVMAKALSHVPEPTTVLTK